MSPSRSQGRELPQPRSCRTPGFPILAGNTTPLLPAGEFILCEIFTSCVLDNGAWGAGREEGGPGSRDTAPGHPRVQGRPLLRGSQSGSWLDCGAGPGAHPEGQVAHPTASGAWGCPVWVARASEPRAFPGEAARASVEWTWDPSGCWGLVVCGCSLETPRLP